LHENTDDENRAQSRSRENCTQTVERYFAKEISETSRKRISRAPQDEQIPRITLNEMTTALLAPDLTKTVGSQHVVELRDLHLNFGDKQVLDGISLKVAPQERLVIIGQSGAGKTTILRLILGILAPTSGEVLFEGQNISRFDHHHLEQMRMRIGMVYQDAALLSSMTVRENLALPLQELTDKTPGEIDKIVDEKLEMVEMRGEDKLFPFELSGGMRKRVGLARALVMEPKLILFDEPTQGLDPVIGALIDKLIIDLTQQTRATSIIVTHLMDSAFHIATRMAMLHRGKIVADDTPANFKASTNPLVVQFLTGSTDGPMLERSKYHMLSPAD
jgi:phospholipid/cholesterol/gamma-HCH transport system ATP-binding protein